MPVASIIPAAIGGITSIFQGKKQADAATTAAKTQSDASLEAARMALAAGERSAADITATGERGAGEIATAGEGAATGISDLSRTVAGDVRGAGESAAQGVRLSADEANGLLRSIYGDAVSWLGDFRGAGTAATQQLQAGIEQGGEFNKKFTAADLELDPGYAFRLAEGSKALERSAAARGGLQSGGTFKALTRYAQGVASDEYQKAFDRYNTDRATRFSMLSKLSDTGLDATRASIAAGETYSGRASGNIMGAGEYGANIRYRGASDAGNILTRGEELSGQLRLGSIGDAARMRTATVGQAGADRIRGTDIAGRAIEGGADARAAGTIASSNAWSNTIGRIGTAAQQLPWGQIGRRRNQTTLAVGPSGIPGYPS
jgi:hypothetical protein